MSLPLPPKNCSFGQELAIIVIILKLKLKVMVTAGLNCYREDKKHHVYFLLLIRYLPKVVGEMELKIEAALSI